MRNHGCGWLFRFALCFSVYILSLSIYMCVFYICLGEVLYSWYCWVRRSMCAKGAFTSPQTPTKIRRSICVSRTSLRLIEWVCAVRVCVRGPYVGYTRAHQSLWVRPCKSVHARLCSCVCEWFCAYAITRLWLTSAGRLQLLQVPVWQAVQENASQGQR